MKKTCIVSDVIGNHDVIHNGENGYVCNQVSDFVTAIKDVQAGNSVELIDVAYMEILKKYNTEIMAEKYSEIYREALINPGGIR